MQGLRFVHQGLVLAVATTNGVATVETADAEHSKVFRRVYVLASVVQAPETTHRRVKSHSERKTTMGRRE